MDEKERVIGRVLEEEERFQRMALSDKSNPLMALGLTIQQLKTLLVLSFEGSASGQELADGLGVGLATVTGIVDRLAAQGLVSRGEDPKDRRIRRVFLANKGKKLVEGIMNAGIEQRRRLLQRLDLTTLQNLEEATMKLNEAALAESGRERNVEQPKAAK